MKNDDTFSNLSSHLKRKGATNGVAGGHQYKFNHYNDPQEYILQYHREFASVSRLKNSKYVPSFKRNERENRKQVSENF